jgi:hypothetical protein
MTKEASRQGRWGEFTGEHQGNVLFPVNDDGHDPDAQLPAGGANEETKEAVLFGENPLGRFEGFAQVAITFAPHHVAQRKALIPWR